MEWIDKAGFERNSSDSLARATRRVVRDFNFLRLPCSKASKRKSNLPCSISLRHLVRHTHFGTWRLPGWYFKIALVTPIVEWACRKLRPNFPICFWGVLYQALPWEWKQWPGRGMTLLLGLVGCNVTDTWEIVLTRCLQRFERCLQLQVSILNRYLQGW
jgi:hypothetical protein